MGRRQCQSTTWRCGEAERGPAISLPEWDPKENCQQPETGWYQTFIGCVHCGQSQTEGAGESYHTVPVLLFLQKTTPSPLSNQKINGFLTSEQWLLGFSKADIEKHTSPERSFPTVSMSPEESTAHSCGSLQQEVSPCKDRISYPWTSGSSFGNEIVYIDPEKTCF